MCPEERPDTCTVCMRTEPRNHEDKVDEPCKKENYKGIDQGSGNESKKVSMKSSLSKGLKK